MPMTTIRMSRRALSSLRGFAPRAAAVREGTYFVDFLRDAAEDPETGEEMSKSALKKLQKQLLRQLKSRQKKPNVSLKSK